MENRKRQLKNCRRTSARRAAYNHGRALKPPLETATISNCPVTINNQRNRGSLTSSTSTSTSMRAFNFNVDSLGRNQNFVSLPKESTDRRLVKVQNTNKTPLYKNPTIHNILMQKPLLLGGVNWDLALEQYLVNGKLTTNYFRFLKKISSKSAPSDRDVIFGNARVLLKQAYGWESSRIQWLLDLERLQEMRRSRAQLCEDDYVDVCCFPFSTNMLM